MSHKKQPNKLQDELFHKISILLDKPISNKSTQQIINIIQHVSSPKQKILTLLTKKYRSDLIVHMIQSCPQIFFNQIIVTDLLNNIQKNILNYANSNNFSLVLAIWNNIIVYFVNNNKEAFYYTIRSPNQTQQLIYRISYENLLKQSITSANLQKKQRLFELIYSNIKVFWQLGMKDNLRKVIVTYVQVFKKYPIIVLSYVKTMRLVIELVYQKMADGNQQQMKQKKQQSKTSPISLYQLPTIPPQHLVQISQQLTTMLITTRQKPLHLLHNQCIKTLISILTTFNKDKDKNNPFTNNEQNHLYPLIYQMNKMLQIYLYNKGTRQQARKLVVVLNSLEQQLSNGNKQKMVRDYSLQYQSQSQYKNSAKMKQNNPVLIQNVIQRTNEYMAKYHVNNVGGNNNKKNDEDNYKINQAHNKVKANNYLKKGQGMGGGRAELQIYFNYNLNNSKSKSNSKKLQKQKQKLKKQQKNNKKKDKYQLLLENCLLDAERQHYKQRQQLKQQQLMRDRINGADMYNNTNSHSNKNKKINKHTNLNNKATYQQQLYQSIYSQFYQPQQQQYQQPYTINNNKKYQYDNNNSTTLLFDNNNTSYSNVTQDDVNQINQLIDLAYSYKFSGQY